MNENKNLKREKLLADLMQTFLETRQKIAQENPEILDIAQNLALMGDALPEKMSVQAKNRLTVMKYLKLKRSQSKLH